MTIKLLLTFLLSAILAASELAQTIVFNEIISANVATLADDDEDYPDWIELYNPSSTSIDLTGFGISDNITDPFKWTFPPITLPVGEYLILFASGKHSTSPELHTNFHIDFEGETLILSNPAGMLIDQVLIPTLPSDIYFVRLTAGEFQDARKIVLIK